MTVAAIVQARFGSSRLPGKVLKPLGNSTLLEVGLSRCARIPGVEIVVCAVPDEPRSDPVAALAEKAGARVVRGSEQDVLARYHKAAQAVGADKILRITSDCPLIDPDVCGQVLALLDKADVDDASNSYEVQWPHGLDCQAVRRSWLDRAFDQATDPFDREHVTPWILKHADVRRAMLEAPEDADRRQRWTVDYPEDYALMVALADHFGPKLPMVGWREVQSLINRRADIKALNIARIDENRLENWRFPVTHRFAGR